MVGIVAFSALHVLHLPAMHGLTHNVKGIVFALVLVLLTMKVKTGNKVVYWFGENLFPIYIYQRIPMILLVALAGKEWVCSYPILYVVVCLAITCVIAYGYKYWQVKLKY